MLCLEKQSRPSLLDGAIENVSLQFLQKKIKPSKLSSFLCVHFFSAMPILLILFSLGEYVFHYYP